VSTPIEILEQNWEDILSPYLVAPSDEQYLEILRRIDGERGVGCIVAAMYVVRERCQRGLVPDWESGWECLMKQAFTEKIRGYVKKERAA
jgi:hypothetical protein